MLLIISCFNGSLTSHSKSTLYYVLALLPVEQVRSMGHQTGSESRVVFLQHMRNTNSNTNVNTVNLRGFMDEVSVHLMYVCI